MIHNAECHIVIDAPRIGSSGIEPSIPTDAEIKEVFPDWESKALIFAGRCAQAEGKSLMHATGQDLFRYGMKFIICESKKLV